VGTYWTNTININLCPPPPPCPATVTISGAYAVPLTQSQTWIKSSGSTIISNTATVKLDADPVNGFAELNTGFESKPLVGYSFVVQALDGCGTGVPMRPVASSNAVSEGIVEKITADKPQGNDRGVSIYPNPTKGNVMIRHSRDVKTIQVYNATGSLVITVNTNNTVVTEIPLIAQPAGIYLIRADGKPAGRVVKQ
jgi:hypothetical protein